MTIPQLRSLFPCLFLILFLSQGCGKDATDKTSSVDQSTAPIPTELVAAHTSGAISKKASVSVVFAKNLAGKSPLREVLADNPFTLTPEVKGQASWDSNNKLVFKPSLPLKPGQSYKVSVN